MELQFVEILHQLSTWADTCFLTPRYRRIIFMGSHSSASRNLPFHHNFRTAAFGKTFPRNVSIFINLIIRYLLFHHHRNWFNSWLNFKFKVVWNLFSKFCLLDLFQFCPFVDTISGVALCWNFCKRTTKLFKLSNRKNQSFALFALLYFINWLRVCLHYHWLNQETIGVWWYSVTLSIIQYIIVSWEKRMSLVEITLIKW